MRAWQWVALVALIAVGTIRLVFGGSPTVDWLLAFAIGSALAAAASWFQGRSVHKDRRE